MSDAAVSDASEGVSRGASEGVRLCACCAGPLLFDGGLPREPHLGVRLLGGYGLFFDDDIGMYWPCAGWERRRAWDSAWTVWLCHDCGVRLLREWPALARLLGTRPWHPADGDRCCEWGWVAGDPVGERLAVEAADRWLSFVLEQIDDERAAEGAKMWSASTVAEPLSEATLRKMLQHYRCEGDEPAC